MTTDPGDLVLDPTCGSGTTALRCRQWGRRWITIDTSRVAVALATATLLTGSFDYYRLNLATNRKASWEALLIRKFTHVTLRGISQNTALDPIFAKHEPILKEKLDTLNSALAEVTPAIRSKLLSKLAGKRNARRQKIYH